MLPLASHFFDLEGFDHQDLFRKNAPVWDALKQLRSYIDSLPPRAPFGQIACEVPKTATLVNPDQITIGKGTVIEPNSLIEGPCMIGEFCAIRHAAYVRPYSIIGNGCVIGHATEVKGSIFFPGASAPHFNYVGDSIIGRRVNLGARTTCANLKLSREEVTVAIGGKKISSGLAKLGAIIGDDSQLGCHIMLNPGTLLKRKTLSRACSLQVSNWNKGDPIKDGKSSITPSPFATPSGAI